MESETILKWRRKYLEKIEEYRQQNRSFFFMKHGLTVMTAQKRDGLTTAEDV
jgi:hypothetical protein